MAEVVSITVPIDLTHLRAVNDKYLAAWWHVAQLNPAEHGDHAAGELVGKLTAEIVRRFLAAAEPELYHHQPRDYYWENLRRFARYVPKDGDFYGGEWVLREDKEDDDA